MNAFGEVLRAQQDEQAPASDPTGMLMIPLLHSVPARDPNVPRPETRPEPERPWLQEKEYWIAPYLTVLPYVKGVKADGVS